MRTYLIALLWIFAAALGLTSCDEDLGEVDVYANWQMRNDEAFRHKMNEAKAAIAQAKANHGDNWQEHCAWRLFQNYRLPSGATATATDSICVEILEAGKGSGCPMSTDSVRVNYLGRLISTDTTQPVGTIGEAFDYSGMSDKEEDVFSPDFSVPTGLLVNNTVYGFATALQKMHIGDRWRVYIPYQMAYGSGSTKAIPAYSMLIFDIQLKQYARAGHQLPPR